MTAAKRIGPRDLHDATIVEVQRDGDQAVVRLKSYEGRAIEIAFGGVVSLRSVDPIGMIVYALIENEAAPPSHRYKFLNWDEEGTQLLEIVAASWRSRR